MEEKEHILAAQKDPQAFRYFYEKYFKEMFRYIYRKTDDESVTADLTQQVFLKAMQHIGKFELRGIPFSSWLYRIASNEVLQYFRDTQKVRVVQVDSSGLQDILGDTDAPVDMHRNDQVFAAMRALPAEDLEFIEMRYFEKRSFKDIAEIKNITENNAKVKVHRILDKIRKRIPAVV
ncbi:MAG: sigma-70 family RNA polymerase sigma factor [Chitinophagales bacterium]